jgi:hypothetical protein
MRAYVLSEANFTPAISDKSAAIALAIVGIRLRGLNALANGISCYAAPDVDASIFRPGPIVEEIEIFFT